MASTPMTYLAMVNKILTRMRENRVGSLSGASEYVQLVQLLVKEAVDEVETAWSWNCLNTTVPLTLVGGTHTYSLSDLGDTFIVNSVWNDTKNYPINFPVTSDYINNQQPTQQPTTDGGCILSPLPLPSASAHENSLPCPPAPCPQATGYG